MRALSKCTPHMQIIQPTTYQVGQSSRWLGTVLRAGVGDNLGGLRRDDHVVVGAGLRCVAVGVRQVSRRRRGVGLGGLGGRRGGRARAHVLPRHLLHLLELLYELCTSVVRWRWHQHVGATGKVF